MDILLPSSPPDDNSDKLDELGLSCWLNPSEAVLGTALGLAEMIARSTLS